MEFYKFIHEDDLFLGYFTLGFFFQAARLQEYIGYFLKDNFNTVLVSFFLRIERTKGVKWTGFVTKKKRVDDFRVVCYLKIRYVFAISKSIESSLNSE